VIGRSRRVKCCWRGLTASHNRYRAPGERGANRESSRQIVKIVKCRLITAVFFDRHRHVLAVSSRVHSTCGDSAALRELAPCKPLCLSSLSPRILAAFTIASTHAAAATNERNPVRTRPAAASEPAEQRVLVKLRSSAAAAAHAQALSVQSKASQGNSAKRHDAALAFGPPDIQAVARNHERPAPAAGAICDGRVHRCDARAAARRFLTSSR